MINCSRRTFTSRSIGFSSSTWSGRKPLKNDLRKIYTKVPVGFPDGSDDEEGTHLHLITCYLEMLADRDLMGAERTVTVMNFWAGDHYRWVYKTVMQDESTIRRVVEQ